MADGESDGVWDELKGVERRRRRVRRPLWGVQGWHRRLAMVGARSVHGGHVQSRCHSLKRFLEHVACSEVAGVGGEFGPFHAELGDGPNMKFVKLGLIYIFRLSVIVIKLTD